MRLAAGGAGAGGAAGVSPKDPQHSPPDLSTAVVVSSPSPFPRLPARHRVPFPPSCRGCGLRAARIPPSTPASRGAPRVCQDQGHGGQEVISIPSCGPVDIWREQVAAWLLGGDLPVCSGHKQQGTELRDRHRSPALAFWTIPGLSSSRLSPNTFQLLEVASNLGGYGGPEGNLGTEPVHSAAGSGWPSHCHGVLQGHGPAWLLLTLCLCLWLKAAGLPATMPRGFGAALLPRTECTRYPAVIHRGLGTACCNAGASRAVRSSPRASQP